MTLHRCKTCGGDLTIVQDGVFKCQCCGNTQSLDKLPVTNSQLQQPNENLSAIAVENIYRSAVEAIANQKYDDAIRLLLNIRGYRDADQKAEHCRKILIENNNAEIYKNACIALSSAKTAENYKTAAYIFEQISAYKDSSALMSKCLSAAELLKNEEMYAQACEMMSECNIHFLQRAANIFGSISKFRDSEAKQKECLSLIENQKNEIFQKNLELQLKKRQASKRKKIILLSIIVSIIALFITFITVRELTHSTKNISIEIVDARSAEDNRYYYVYTDYEITNNTAQTIDYIEVVTYVTDKNGKSLGTITSCFGSLYGSNTLNLKAHNSTIQETYLSEYKSEQIDDFFVAIYNNGIKELIITHEIADVKWADGYKYEK